jgi:hypothetical protein
MTVIQRQRRRLLQGVLTVKENGGLMGWLRIAFRVTAALLVFWMLGISYPSAKKQDVHSRPTLYETISTHHHRNGSHAENAGGLRINTTPSQTSDTSLREKEFIVAARLLVPAPIGGSITYQNMDAMCTLKRYPHLLERFCDHLNRYSCKLEPFKAYMKNHGARENLIVGCPLAEAVSYAKCYPDLFSGYCKGNETKCEYYPLREHYEQHGRKEGRVWQCDFQPHPPTPPPPPTRRPKPLPPMLEDAPNGGIHGCARFSTRYEASHLVRWLYYHKRVGISYFHM